jgi:membrane protein YdbS with pleckstrin-like domain
MAYAIHPSAKGFYIRFYTFPTLLAVICILAILFGAIAPYLLGIIGVPLMVIACAVPLVGVIHTLLYVRATTLSIEEGTLIYETGILAHYKKTLSIHMVTDSMTYRSFIDKIIGIASLRISTAGSTGYEIIADGLDWWQAEEMGKRIYEKINEKKKMEKK